MSKNYFIGLKKTCLGCFRNRRRYVTKNNETGFQEGRRNKYFNLQYLNTYLSSFSYVSSTILINRPVCKKDKEYIGLRIHCCIVYVVFWRTLFVFQYISTAAIIFKSDSQPTSISINSVSCTINFFSKEGRITAKLKNVTLKQNSRLIIVL